MDRDDPINVGFPTMSRTELVASYKAQADEAAKAGRFQVAQALLDLVEATIRGEGGETAFAKLRAASLAEPR
jgi:hypothetical protein